MASPSCDAATAIDTAAWSAARLATAAESRTPLHFPGGARDFRRRWPAFEAWTATTLLNPPYADVPIDVELSELRAFTSYEPDADAARHLLRLDENRANAASRRWTTTFGTFVRYTLGRSERAPYAYLSVPLARILRDTPDRSHGKQFVNDVMRVDDGGTALIDDDTIQVDDELVVNGAARAREAPMVSLWAGGANVTTQAHYDLHANLFVQVAGRKRVALWPPEAAPSLYLYGALHPRFRKSRLPIADDLSELPNATLAAFPRAAGVMAKARIVILEPHDVLFIPPLWLHHVTALDELTLSVNVFSHSDEQAVFDELFALAVPFEASWMDADASGRRPLLLAATRAWLRRLAEAELDGGRAEMRQALLDAGYQPPDGAPAPAPLDCGPPLPEGTADAFAARAAEAATVLARLPGGAPARRLTLLRYADMALGNFVGLDDAYAFARDCV